VSDQQTARTNPTTVLVVDDDPETAQLVRAALSTQGVEIRSVASAAGARDTLAATDVSLIVLNIVLPDADGRFLITQFDQDPRASGIPVIIVLGFFGPQPRDECLRLGAMAVLEKPLDADALRAAAEGPLQHVATIGRDPQHDRVTGLLSRAALAEAFAQQVVDASGRGMPLSIARLDIDVVGPSESSQLLARDDELLRGVGARLVDELSEGTIIGRWEGNDFVVLFPNTNTAGAMEQLRKAQTAFTSSRFERSDDGPVELTFSGAVIPVEPETLMDEAVATADHLLVRARTEGPSRLFSPDDVVEHPEPTILVAEDDRVAASLVKHRLARAGFDVVHRDDGAKALSAAMERNVSLFVLDIRMPGMDGLELLKRLRESDRYAEAPVLMLTSLGREEDIVRAFDLGATDYVTKPFSPVELLARVQRLLRRQDAGATQ